MSFQRISAENCSQNNRLTDVFIGHLQIKTVLVKKEGGVVEELICILKTATQNV